MINYIIVLKIARPNIRMQSSLLLLKKITVALDTNYYSIE